MALIKFNQSLPSMFNDWDILDSFFDRPMLSNQGSAKFNVIEHDDKVEVIAEIPGFNKDNINVEYEKGYLAVSGEMKHKEEKKDAKYLVREIGDKSFYRKFYLGDSIDSDNINASFKDGELTIELPKSEKTKFKRIDIN